MHVRHRPDDLEIYPVIAMQFMSVRHRPDDLEMIPQCQSHDS